MRRIRLSETVAKLIGHSPEAKEVPKEEPACNVSRELIAFSRLLGKEIRVRWEGLSPQKVFVDDISFALDEIDRLKNITDVKELKSILLVKEVFSGRIVN